MTSEKPHSTTIIDLVPGAGYAVNIAAENSYALGNFTPTQFARPMEDFPGL